MSVTQYETEKPGVVGQYRLHETDTGSPEVQVALLTNRITYLKDESPERYARLIERLGLRK